MAKLFDDLPDAKHTDLPAITRTEKLARDAWLGHFEASIQSSYDRYREASKHVDPDAVKGQLQYYSHQIATIKWLRGLNWQWKEKGK